MVSKGLLRAFVSLATALVVLGLPLPARADEIPVGPPQVDFGDVPESGVIGIPLTGTGVPRAGAPDAPTDVVATAGPDRAFVSWTSPADNGNPILSYLITASPGGATQFVDATQTTDTPSLLSNAATPSSVPGAPSLTNATVGLGAVHLEFSPPTDTGGLPILGYEGSCISEDGGASVQARGSASPLLLSGLTNFKTYSCSVAAQNDIGFGPASMSIPIVMPHLPGAVVITNATAALGAVNLVFSPPVDTGGLPIVAYQASCSSADGGAPGLTEGTSPPQATALTVHVTGLTNFKTYSCSVAARNALGSGPPSSSVPITMPHLPGAPVASGVFLGECPGKPRGCSYTGIIQLSFEPPTDTGGLPITDFQWTCDGVLLRKNFSYVSVRLDGSARVCSVTVENALGVGSPSAAISVSGEDRRPRVPTVTGVSAGQGIGSIRVLLAPGPEEGPHFSYVAECTSSDGGAPSESSSRARSVASGETPAVLVSDLTPGKTYRCTAFAVNVYGSSSASAPSEDIVIPAA